MIPQISVQELAARLANNDPVHLLDVRQPLEHRHAALPNSQLIPLNELSARIAEIQPDLEALVVVYCHHGMRSLHAAHLLLQSGFPQVASLAGGIDAWSLLIDATIPRY